MAQWSSFSLQQRILADRSVDTEAQRAFAPHAAPLFLGRG
jgi:hypothetical protein